MEQQQCVLVFVQPADKRKADKDVLVCLGLMESTLRITLHLFHCLQIH